MKRTSKAAILLLCAAILLCSSAAAKSSSPTAEDRTVFTYENRTVSGTVPLAPGSTMQLLSRPEHGVVSLSETGYTYTPYQTRRGVDRFTYLIQDESGTWSREAAVTVHILPQESSYDYADLHGHPVEYAALRLAEENIYVGAAYGGQTWFHPEESLSRAEFLALTLSAAGIPAVRAASVTEEFPALPVWAGGYAAAAVQEGIITGNGAAEDPLRLTGDLPITWAEAAVILRNTLSLPDTDNVSTSAEIPVWAASAWQAMANAGYPMAHHSPEVVVTRADAALLLESLLPSAKAAVPTGLFSWTTVS